MIQVIKTHLDLDPSIPLLPRLVAYDKQVQNCYERSKSMHNIGKHSPLIMLLTWHLLWMGEQIYAKETGVYQAPDISKFILIDEKDDDGDGDGVNETHIMYYVNATRDSVFSMTTKQRLWAWSLESQGGGDAGDLEHSYVIRDSDCDGTYDERYNMQEKFYLPECLK